MRATSIPRPMRVDQAGWDGSGGILPSNCLTSFIHNSSHLHKLFYHHGEWLCLLCQLYLLNTKHDEYWQASSNTKFVFFYSSIRRSLQSLLDISCLLKKGRLSGIFSPDLNQFLDLFVQDIWYLITNRTLLPFGFKFQLLSSHVRHSECDLTVTRITFLVFIIIFLYFIFYYTSGLVHINFSL